MQTVECIIREVWTSKGPLKVNERAEVPDDEAARLVEKGQAILVEEEAPKRRGRPPGSKNKPKVEGEDVPAEEEEN